MPGVQCGRDDGAARTRALFRRVVRTDIRWRARAIPIGTVHRVAVDILRHDGCGGRGWCLDPGVVRQGEPGPARDLHRGDARVGLTRRRTCHDDDRHRISPLSEADHRAQLRRAVIASTVGTTIEWYDFLLYSIVTGLVFGKLFFPKSDPLVGVLRGVRRSTPSALSPARSARRSSAITATASAARRR